jgi:Protein of unknown function (DUF4038)
VAFTVTATPGGASFNRGVDILVRVYTNATEAGGASSGSANAAGGTAQGSLTPNFSSSAVAFAVTADNLTVLPAGATNNTYDLNGPHSTDNWGTACGHYTGTVTASSALTYGAGSAGAGDHENWCAYEIPASGGTITLDGSSPAGVSSDTGTSATTASFTPPAGSVLVVMVAAGGSGAGAGVTCAITDTSGLGMTWTKRVTSSTSDNFQPTFIFTTTVPAASPDKPMGNPSLGWPAPLTQRFGPNEPFQVGGFSVDPAPALAVNAGVATVGAVAVQPPGFNSFVSAIAGSGYNAWFTDQYGVPKPLILEMAFALPWNAGRWNSGNWQSDYDTYFNARGAQGHTAWYGTAWSNLHVDGTLPTGGRTWDSIYPLNVNGTPGAIATGSETITLNNSFWTRIDYLFASAMRNGITCFLNLGMSYDFTVTGAIWQNLSTTQAHAFGAALATRYPQSSYPNVQWFFGDDDNGGNDTMFSQMLSGIQSVGDTRSLISEEQTQETNCHIEFDNKTSFGGTFAAPNATYNWTYSYNPVYHGIEDGYSEGGSFTHLPVIWGDGPWYGDNAGDVDYTIRRFTWWSLASGARGFNNTSGPSDLAGSGVWRWQSGAAAACTSDPNGNWVTQTTKQIVTYFTGLTDWNKLIPDTGNVFITAGRGTRGTNPSPSAGTTNYGSSNNYVAGSITPGGTLAVIYCNQAMSITIDQTKMGAGYTATWVDPLSLAQTSTSTGTTYSSSGLGNNSAGDPDWLLVLQAPASLNVNAGVATVGVVAKAPVDAVTVTAGVASVSAVSSAPKVAEATTTGVASSSVVAPAPLTATTVTAGVASVAVVAKAPTAAESVSPGVSAVLAVAPAPSTAETVTAGVATVPVVAPQPVISEAVSAGVAIIGVVAPGASASASGSSSPNAGVAPVSVVATAPTAALTVTAGVATVAATVAAPRASSTVSTSAALITTTAPAPATPLQLSLAVAQVNINAPAPSVSSGTSVSLTVAQVNVSAPAPTLSVKTTLAVAQETINAPAPVVAAGVTIALPVATESVSARVPAPLLQLALSVAHVTEVAYPLIIGRPALPLTAGAGGKVSRPEYGGTVSQPQHGGSVTTDSYGGSVS